MYTVDTIVKEMEKNMSRVKNKVHDLIVDWRGTDNEYKLDLEMETTTLMRDYCNEVNESMSNIPVGVHRYRQFWKGGLDFLGTEIYGDGTNYGIRTCYTLTHYFSDIPLYKLARLDSGIVEEALCQICYKAVLALHKEEISFQIINLERAIDIMDEEIAGFEKQFMEDPIDYAYTYICYQQIKYLFERQITDAEEKEDLNRLEELSEYFKEYCPLEAMYERWRKMDGDLHDAMRSLFM